MKGPPRHWQWVEIFNSADAISGCANHGTASTGDCTGTVTLDFIVPSLAISEIPPPDISVARLEMDLWFLPDLTGLDCDTVDTAWLMRAGLFKARGSQGRLTGDIPRPFAPAGAGNALITDWSSYHWLNRWEHLWETLEEFHCETLAAPLRDTTVSGKAVSNLIYLPSASAVDSVTYCASGPPDGQTLQAGACPALAGTDNGRPAWDFTMDISQDGQVFGGTSFHFDRAWHVRCHRNLKLVLKSYDSFGFTMMWGDPFGTTPAVPMDFMGSARLLVSTG